MCTMKLVYLLAICFAVIPAVRGQCTDSYNIYEIFNEGGSKTYTEFGERTLTATKYNVNDCNEWSSNPTGTVLNGMTTLSIDTDFQQTNGKCRVNNSTGTSHYYTFQAIIVRSPGWKFLPKDFQIMDIDLEGTSESQALRKSAIVFGFNGNTIISPTYTFSATTVLREQTFKVEGPEMAQLGFNSVTRQLPGVMYNALPSLFDCPQGGAQGPCTTTMNFAQPVEGIAILYALEKKSTDVRTSLMSIAPIETTCGCRCEQTSSNLRTITEPVPGVPGECTQSVTDASVIHCQDDGTGWCERGTRGRYITVGSVLGNGNYQCTLADAPYAIQYLYPFA